MQTTSMGTVSRLIERRCQRRIKVNIPIKVISNGIAPGGRRFLLAKSLDLSGRGIAIISSQRLPNPVPSLTVLLNLDGNLSSIRMGVKNVWMKTTGSGFSYGMRFLSVNDKNRSKLKRFLEEKRDKMVIASYLPSSVVVNQQIIDDGLKTTTKVLQRSLGAMERRVAARDETAADMMAKVAEKLLKESGLLPQHIDRIICATDPGDSAEPDTAAAVQVKIGAIPQPAFGISMSCTGWLTGVDLALRCLATGDERILVLAASLMGSRPYFRNLMHRAIFGDGAGGILLEKQHRNRFLAIAEIADGRYYSKIFLPYPWSVRPEEISEEYQGSFYMSPNQDVFFSAMDNYLPRFAERLLGEAKVGFKDIDYFLLHYPSKPLFERSVALLRVPRSKILPNHFERYGNVVAAEIPIVLDEAVRSGRVQKGDLLFVLTYGAGFSMGGMIMRY